MTTKTSSKYKIRNNWMTSNNPILIKCIILIKPSPSSFNFLNIVTTNRCLLHHLRPADGNFRYKRRICGNQTSIQYILHKKSNTSFRFVSKANITSLQHTGFELAYEQVPIASLTPVQLDTVYVNGNPVPYKSHPWF